MALRSAALAAGPGGPLEAEVIACSVQRMLTVHESSRCEQRRTLRTESAVAGSGASKWLGTTWLTTEHKQD
eukprot:5923794-Amphidinium_carterae.1